jgi:hypothetical protein
MTVPDIPHVKLVLLRLPDLVVAEKRFFVEHLVKLVFWDPV